MSTIYVAYTEPLNPPSLSDTPILTQEQAWTGLKLKVRRPQDFIPALDDCQVVEERDGGQYIVREAHVAATLQESPMAGTTVREECTLHAPVKTHFTLPNGSTVENIISVGPDGALYLTFTYEWKVSDGESKTEKGREGYLAIAQSSVQATIVAMRRLAGEGDL